MKLGYVQKEVLVSIRNQGIDSVHSRSGISLHRMLSLTGTAAKFRHKYQTAVQNAVRRHNAGVCEYDCPISRYSRIASGPVGPRGGFGYYIV